MVIDNIRGREIHWDRGREELREFDELFLRRLAASRKIAYIFAESEGSYDNIKLSKTRRYGALAISVPVLARLLGFTSIVELPKIPTFEEYRQELPEESPNNTHTHYRQLREEITRERARLRMSITNEELREFTTWLDKNFKVRFLTAHSQTPPPVPRRRHGNGFHW